jgi:hypothetical protein
MKQGRKDRTKNDHPSPLEGEGSFLTEHDRIRHNLLHSEVVSIRTLRPGASSQTKRDPEQKKKGAAKTARRERRT